MEGWIKLHRKIIEHEIWKDTTTFRLFMLLLLKSTHQSYEHRGLKLQAGQFIRSYSKLAEDLTYKEGRGLKKVSKSTIANSIKKLVENEMITVSETEVGTMFTVVNYQLYQSVEDVQKSNAERIAERPNTKKTTQKDAQLNGKFIEIVEYLNKQAKTNFKHSSKKTQSLIKARMREGYDVEDFKRVIDNKTPQWINNEWRKYIRPETLFGVKFESYLNEKSAAQPNEKTGQQVVKKTFDFDLSKGE